MLTLIVFLPLLAGVIVLLFPERFSRWIAAAFTLGVFILSLFLYFGLLNGSATDFGSVVDPKWLQHVSWINVAIGENFRFRVDYALGTDGLSMPLIILNALLTFLAVIGSWRVERRQKFYMALMLFLETGVAGVFASFDLFLFFLFWEIELIPMFLLIGIWGGARREYAAWKFLIYTLVGSAFTLGGIFYLYFATGGQSAYYPYLAVHGPLLSGNVATPWTLWPISIVIFLLLYTGFAVKIPMWPLHTWLPDAHTEAPTAVSVLLAGVLLKMGAYGLIRICLTFVPGGAELFAPALAVFAAINVIWGAGASMVQRDMKRMIAYSSVSHMGYVLLGVAAAAAAGANMAGAAAVSFKQAALTGAVLQMFTHGAITAMLFFSVGVLYDKAHTREIDVFGGIAKRMPILILLFSVACFAALGLPGLAGFVSEYLVFTGSFAILPGPTAAAVFGVVLTAAYLLWMIRRAFYGPLNVKWNFLTDASPREAFPLVALGVVILFVGIYPNPIVSLLQPSLREIVATIHIIALR